MGGRGSSSGIKPVAMMVKKILSPTTKADYESRLTVIAESGQAGYVLKVSVRDWENYGKSRTYFKIDAYRESDNRYHHSQDYGYYDNVSGKYVESPKLSLNGTLWTASGNDKITEDEIKKLLKKRR